MSGVRSPQHPPAAKAVEYSGVVVQLVRIPACHAGVAGSSPVHSASSYREQSRSGFGSFLIEVPPCLNTSASSRTERIVRLALRPVPHHPVRLLRHRLLLPIARGRRHASRRRATCASASRSSTRHCATRPRTTGSQLARPVRSFDHGQPGGAPRGARRARVAEAAGASAPNAPAFAWATSSSPSASHSSRSSRSTAASTSDRYEQIAKSQGMTHRGARRAPAAGLSRAAVPRVHHRHHDRAALDARQLHQLSEQTREVSVVNLAPDAYACEGEGHPGAGEGVLRRTSGRVHDARARARRIRASCRSTRSRRAPPCRPTT